LPDSEERRRLLEHFTRQVSVEGDLERLLRATEGATPAMLKEIVKRAVVSALSQGGPERNGDPLTLRVEDLLLATEQVRAMRDPEIVPGSFGFREHAPR
jgi:SpoVK/Ycf46/Vps4 family AAA+-type ATPase